MQQHVEGWSSEAFVLVQVPQEGDAKMESDTQSHWGRHRRRIKEGGEVDGEGGRKEG